MRGTLFRDWASHSYTTRFLPSLHSPTCTLSTCPRYDVPPYNTYFRLQQAGQNSVYIGNLAWSVTSEQLQAVLQQAGPVVSCEVQTASNGKSRGFGLATFADAASAQHAITSLRDYEIEGRLIFLREDRGHLPRPEKDVTTKPRRAKAVVPDTPAEPSTKLFCGNLPWRYTGDDLKGMFTAHSPTSAMVQVGRDGRSRGFGIVEFANVDQASAAMNALNNTAIDGREMNVRFDRK